MLRSLVDIQKEYGSVPFGCQEEGRKKEFNAEAQRSRKWRVIVR
jgi:hypothetical protein